MSYKEIRIEDYLYDLPQERIASFPLQSRDESKLLVYRDGRISETRFFNLPELLPENSLLIWNNTRVIPARLMFRKPTGASIEIFLLEPEAPRSYAEMFEQTGTCTWKVIIGNQKKWKGEQLVRILESESGPISLTADFAHPEDLTTVLLNWTPAEIPFAQILELFGKTPIPPYLKRDSNDQDRTRYQTVYANYHGSVAAPTAGLHFTPELIEKLKSRNIRFSSLTLHVGSGTFVPVKTETIGDHLMHPETVIMDKSIIRDLLVTRPEDLTVVGTTSMRSLESLVWLGRKISRQPGTDPGHLQVDQWEPYGTHDLPDARESLQTILNFMDTGELEHIQFITRLMIVPGYRCRLVNRLITNFHQPSSTLLLLVSALTGDNWRNIYDYALANNFRFLSYGDSSMIEIQPDKHG